jgi:protein-disulfide isomerase
MADDRVLDDIKKDIEVGIGYELKGTPAFIVEGKVYYGKIPEEAMGQLP